MDQARPDTVNTITNAFIAGPAVQVGTVTGNVTIALSRPDYQVHWLGPTPPPAYIPERHRAPSRLLDTRRAVVPYRNRPTEQQRLLAWLDSEPPASVLLLHGAGGRGKTRLANAFAAHCHATRWRVAHALNSQTDKPSMLPGTPSGDEPGTDVLVAVDYAERWPVDDLLTLISDLTREHSTVRLRILLLARSIQDLWQPLCDHLDPTPIELPDPIELRDLTDSPDARTGAFLEAAQAFHDALGLSGTCTTTPPDDLGHDDYASPLILHMAALSAVCAERDHEELPHRDELSGYLLAHERRLWPPHPHAADAVFLATLFGPAANEHSALSLFEIAGVTDGTATGRELLAWHDRVYPSQHGLAPLLPDRFGEDYVASHLKTHPRAVELVERVALSKRASLGPRPMTVLVAAAARNPHVRTVLWEILPRCPRLYLTPGAELIHLAIAHAPFAIKERLVNQLPHPELAMRRLGLELTRSMAEDLSDDMPAAVRAGVLMDLACRIADMEPDAQVQDLVEHSTSLMMTAWRQAPSELAIPAARVMINGGVLSASTGDLPMALTRAETAIEILRSSESGDVVDREILLVLALVNLADYLEHSGREDECAEPEAEALELAEHATGAASMLPNLANVMTGLAKRFTRRNKVHEAVRAAEIGAKVYVRLSRRSPEFYALPAALSIDEVGIYRTLAGQPDEALETALVAVRLARNGLDADPSAFEPVLPRLLFNAASIEMMTSTAASAARAHEYATEAVERYQTLLPAHPMLTEQLEHALRLLREIEKQRAPRTPHDPAPAAPEAAPGSPDNSAR